MADNSGHVPEVPTEPTEYVAAEASITPNRIIIGPLAEPLCEFNTESENILTIKYVNEVDVSGSCLSIDQFTLEVDYDVTGGYLISPSDYDGIVSSDGYYIAASDTIIDIRTIPYGTVLHYYRGDGLFGKYYIKNVERIKKTVYRFNCESAIGLLDNQYHFGNVYNLANFSDVLAEIIGNAVPYTVSSEVANIQVSGWLPYDTKRNNLHQLLFAHGVCVKRNEDFDMEFSFLENATSIQVSEDNIYIDGSVDYSSPVKSVDVTGHTFFKTEDDEEVEVKLYDSSEATMGGTDHILVLFGDNAPAYDLQANGNLTIDKSDGAELSGPNYAYVSGAGTLTGKRYTHSTHILSKSSTFQQSEKIATVDKCYLVNPLNDENVARRVLAYYSSQKTVSASIVVNDERAGDMITATDTFGDPISAFIAAMDCNVSSNIKAECKLITDYVPTNGGNNYDSYVVLTGSGTFVIPEGIRNSTNPSIKFVLCSGGQGGQAGYNGESVSTTGEGQGGAGGEAGAPGSPGRIKTIVLDVSSIESLSFSCGSGGAGGATNGALGELGGDTVLGSYSTANGSTATVGVINLFTGERYATKGDYGIPGGDGIGTGSSSATYVVDDSGVAWRSGSKGTNEGSKDSGGIAGGGYGGGPAVGANGGNGGNGDSGTTVLTGGNGGNGASAIAQSKVQSILGGGGHGGHGGGGGGSGGSCFK